MFSRFGSFLAFSDKNIIYFALVVPIHFQYIVNGIYTYVKLKIGLRVFEVAFTR